jgi:hypothetical protein
MLQCFSHWQRKTLHVSMSRKQYPSKTTRCYHNFKLIIIHTGEINIKCMENIWRGWVGFAAKTPGCDDAMKQANFLSPHRRRKFKSCLWATKFSASDQGPGSRSYVHKVHREGDGQQVKTFDVIQQQLAVLPLTLSLLMSCIYYIYGAPCKTRNFNVVYTGWFLRY